MGSSLQPTWRIAARRNWNSQLGFRIHPAHLASYHGRMLHQHLKEAHAMSYMPTPITSADAQLRQSSIISQVYAWMTAGLLVTGAVAAYTAQSQVLLQLIFGNPFGIWVLFIAQIAMVIGLSAGIGRLAPTMATGLFIAYAAL